MQRKIILSVMWPTRKIRALSSGIMNLIPTELSNHCCSGCDLKDAQLADTCHEVVQEYLSRGKSGESKVEIGGREAV